MRRRYRYLSHFPLTTTFQLCEIDLKEILPAEALAPFRDDLKKRERQRKQLARKEHEDKIKAEADTSYSLPVHYNNNMQAYDSSSTFSMDDFEALGSLASTVAASSPSVQGRQLFSNVARLGFAAGCGSPSLHIQESAPEADVGRTSSSTGINGSTNQGAQTVHSFANVISRERPETRKTNETGKKGKKSSRVLLSTAGGRRY